MLECFFSIIIKQKKKKERSRVARRNYLFFFLEIMRDVKARKCRSSAAAFLEFSLFYTAALECRPIVRGLEEIIYFFFCVIKFCINLSLDFAVVIYTADSLYLIVLASSHVAQYALYRAHFQNIHFFPFYVKNTPSLQVYPFKRLASTPISPISSALSRLSHERER